MSIITSWSQVIGGIQRFSAIRQLRQKGIRSITRRNCAVYGNGLSRLATLILARRHNEINQVQRVTTFPEIAASCRRLLFVHFATSGDHDPSYMPDVPRYNAKPYIDFKHECLQYLVSSRVVSACIIMSNNIDWSLSSHLSFYRKMCVGHVPIKWLQDLTWGAFDPMYFMHPE